MERTRGTWTNSSVTEAREGTLEEGRSETGVVPREATIGLECAVSSLDGSSVAVLCKVIRDVSIQNAVVATLTTDTHDSS